MLCHKNDDEEFRLSFSLFPSIFHFGEMIFMRILVKRRVDWWAASSLISCCSIIAEKCHQKWELLIEFRRMITLWWWWVYSLSSTLLIYYYHCQLIAGALMFFSLYKVIDASVWAEVRCEEWEGKRAESNLHVWKFFSCYHLMVLESREWKWGQIALLLWLPPPLMMMTHQIAIRRRRLPLLLSVQDD